jgi:hypothetical protein
VSPSVAASAIVRISSNDWVERTTVNGMPSARTSASWATLARM